MKATVLAGLLALGLSVGAVSMTKAECGCCKCKAPATQASAAPVNAKCPVEHGNVDPKYTCVYEGKTIGFCCGDCIPEFKKDPAKYMKDLK